MACKIHGNSKLVCEKCIGNCKGAVVVVIANRVAEVGLFISQEQSDQIFINHCRNYLSNFDEYTNKDIDTILEAGEELIGDRGSISIYWF